VDVVLTTEEEYQVGLESGEAIGKDDVTNTNPRLEAALDICEIASGLVDDELRFELFLPPRHVPGGEASR